MALPTLPFEVHDLIVDALISDGRENMRATMDHGMVSKRWLDRVRHALFLKRAVEINTWILDDGTGIAKPNETIKHIKDNPNCALKEYVRRLSVEEGEYPVNEEIVQYFQDQGLSTDLDDFLLPFLCPFPNVTRLRFSESNYNKIIKWLPSFSSIQHSITLLALSFLEFAGATEVHLLVDQFPNVKTLKIDHVEILTPSLEGMSACRHCRPETGWELQSLDLGYQYPAHFGAFLTSLTLFPCNISDLSLTTCVSAHVIAGLLEHLGPMLLELSLRVEDYPGNTIDLTGSVHFPLSLKNNTRLKVLQLEAFDFNEVKSIQETLWVSQLVGTISSDSFQTLRLSHMSSLDYVHLFNWEALKEVLEADSFPTSPLVYAEIAMMQYKPSELRPRLDSLLSLFEDKSIGKVAWLKPWFYCKGPYALFA